MSEEVNYMGKKIEAINKDKLLIKIKEDTNKEETINNMAKGGDKRLLVDKILTKIHLLKKTS